MCTTPGDPHDPQIAVLNITPDQFLDLGTSSELAEEPNPMEDDTLKVIDNHTRQPQSVEINPIEIGTGPSCRSCQSSGGDYRPPAWPRSIVEIMEVIWSIAVVLSALSYEGVRNVVRTTQERSIDINMTVEIREDREED
ncbi:hypothetical protein PM082_022907 [Marasmius tenuissimus]|nr:hypothetical protein PM082_022907 [Marasmius tenuissimus]